MDAHTPLIRRAAEALDQAPAILIAAGAGMGVDSGLPDFRGADGFWHAYPALRTAGLDFQDIASPDAFHRHPRLAWGFYGHRLGMYRRVPPHAGFDLLRAWGRRRANGCAVFTSNVDGHFQRSGLADVPVHECHGSIHHLQCRERCCDRVWPADALLPQVDEQSCEWQGELPLCPHCGGMARPNVLMFGDGAWCDTRERVQAHAFTQWLRAAPPGMLVIELGAGTAVGTVRRAAQGVAQRPGGRLLRINLREAQVSRPQDIALALPALEALRRIDAVLASFAVGH